MFTSKSWLYYYSALLITKLLNPIIFMPLFYCNHSGIYYFYSVILSVLNNFGFKKILPFYFVDKICFIRKWVPLIKIFVLFDFLRHVHHFFGAHYKLFPVHLLINFVSMVIRGANLFFFEPSNICFICLIFKTNIISYLKI